jgi:hypothetical protein
MTRTEERLLDALDSSAGQVRDGRLRSLPVLEPGAGAGSRKAWRGWLVPAAAAVSVALVIGLALAVTGGASWRPASGAPVVSNRAGAGHPTYFADVTSSPSGLTVQVRSTSTGSVVASAPSPQAPGWALILNAVSASPDGRTFYVAFNAIHGSQLPTGQIWIYRLSVTNSALAAPLTRIKGGVIPGGAVVGVTRAMAVSPDGTKLALTAATGPITRNDRSAMDEIIVLDLRTAARSTWQGGLYRSGKTFTITDVSWTADGRSLVFLALWCRPFAASNDCEGTSGPQASRNVQVRSLSVGTGGGALSRSALLLTESNSYPFIADAVAGPTAGELNVALVFGAVGESGWVGAAGPPPTIVVERVSAVTGALISVEYRSAPFGQGRQPNYVTISRDPSGRYLLLTYGGPAGFSTGWIHDSKLRFLPIAQPYVGYPISAW